MNLSMPFAMQMVEELSTILSQHINFIDKEGVIIASSDQQRIGSVHMGAKKLIQENLPYIVIESDLEYPGSKQGVNLPIVVDDEIIGVIGIT
ncbi:MAG: sugar diacid recognition, partial [Erysipelothrix sp.]|nr:sugar diacid recognition [Erysipelothrix sp.]